MSKSTKYSFKSDSRVSTAITVTADFNGNVRHLIPRKIFYKAGRRYMYYRGMFALLTKVYSRDAAQKTYNVKAFLPSIN